MELLTRTGKIVVYPEMRGGLDPAGMVGGLPADPPHGEGRGVGSVLKNNGGGLAMNPLTQT